MDRHVNVLMIGSPPEIEAMLATVTPYGYPCRYSWPEVPPSPCDVPCTVVVRELTALSAAERQTLQELLDHTAAPLQILSTSSSAIVRDVETGKFPASLYYRLNVLLLGHPDVGPPIGSAADREGALRGSG
jgi:hypothetical protein